jgi:Zn finger protein HypA/HybF involved in hydrogenase expression
MADAYNPPKGECRQCWAHAHDKSIHKALDRNLDHCPQCVAHMVGGHGNMIVK